MDKLSDVGGPIIRIRLIVTDSNLAGVRGDGGRNAPGARRLGSLLVTLVGYDA